MKPMPISILLYGINLSGIMTETGRKDQSSSPGDRSDRSGRKPDLPGRGSGGKGGTYRITAEQVAAVVESIDKKLEREPENKPLKKKAREFKKDILPRKQKYEKSLGNI